MNNQIRVTAYPHDPVVMNRLVRLLIAQAQLEQTKQQALDKAAAARQLDEEAAS